MLLQRSSAEAEAERAHPWFLLAVIIPWVSFSSLMLRLDTDTSSNDFRPISLVSLAQAHEASQRRIRVACPESPEAGRIIHTFRHNVHFAKNFFPKLPLLAGILDARILGEIVSDSSTLGPPHDSSGTSSSGNSLLDYRARLIGRFPRLFLLARAPQSRVGALTQQPSMTPVPLPR